jgi:hypothetical protein
MRVQWFVTRMAAAILQVFYASNISGVEDRDRVEDA